MQGFTESNITLNFPDKNYFRLEKCQGYSTLSGDHFKEMDACWYDQFNNEYWFLELKDFSNVQDHLNNNARINDIVKKSVDSLAMFLSNKHNYPFGSQNFSQCFHSGVNDHTLTRIYTIIHCLPESRSSIQILNDKFRNRFTPYAKLFGIIHYGIIEHSQAMRIIPRDIVS